MSWWTFSDLDQQWAFLLSPKPNYRRDELSEGQLALTKNSHVLVEQYVKQAFNRGGKKKLNNSIKKVVSSFFFVGEVDDRHESVSCMLYRSGTASEHSMAALPGTSSYLYFTLSGVRCVNYSSTPQQFLTKQAVCGSLVLHPLPLKVDSPL